MTCYRCGNETENKAVLCPCCRKELAILSDKADTAERLAAELERNREAMMITLKTIDKCITELQSIFVRSALKKLSCDCRQIYAEAMGGLE